jgi:hypothetical protein
VLKLPLDVREEGCDGWDMKIIKVTDSSTAGLFIAGFDHALDLWRAGTTPEVMSHLPEYSGPCGRGMFAVCEGLNGWLEVARREARAHGVGSEVIERLIERVRAA